MMDMNNIGIEGYSAGATTSLLMGGAQIDMDYLTELCIAQDNDDSVIRVNECTYWYDNREEIEVSREQFGSLGEDGLWTATTVDSVQAIMPMAPCHAPVIGVRGLSGAYLPTLIMANTRDEICPYEDDAVFMFENAGSDPLYMISVIGETHAGGTQNAEALAAYRHFAVAFFGYYLQGIEEYAEYLSEEYVSQYEKLAWGVYTGE